MKKFLLVFIIALVSVNLSYAQDDVYRIVQEMPEFPGGQDAMFQFICDSITYPAEAKNANITGTVYISFVVEKDGSLSNIEIANGSEDIGGGCLEEAIRVVKLMPNWTPGKQRGNPVRVSYVLPIQYVLSGNDDIDEKSSKKKKSKKLRKTKKK